MNSNIEIIMLSGKANVGKDTYYKTYKKNHNDEIVVRYAYADAIKDIVSSSVGWEENIEGKNEKIRSLLQDIGRAYRKFDINFWVDIVINKILSAVHLHEKFNDKDKRMVIFITDVRYQNEVLRMREMIPEYVPITVYRLHRDFESELTPEQQKDSSELGLPDELIDKDIYL